MTYLFELRFEGSHLPFRVCRLHSPLVEPDCDDLPPPLSKQKFRFNTVEESGHVPSSVVVGPLWAAMLDFRVWHRQ